MGCEMWTSVEVKETGSDGGGMGGGEGGRERVGISVVDEGSRCRFSAGLLYYFRFSAACRCGSEKRRCTSPASAIMALS
jgi:hypothetical protein